MSAVDLSKGKLISMIPADTPTLMIISAAGVMQAALYAYRIGDGYVEYVPYENSTGMPSDNVDLVVGLCQILKARGPEFNTEAVDERYKQFA